MNGPPPDTDGPGGFPAEPDGPGSFPLGTDGRGRFPGDPDDPDDPAEDDAEAGLEQALRDAAALLDPVPTELVQAAVDAYTLRTLDAELADLTFDSLAEPVLVRGGRQPRLATFHAPGVTIDVEITVMGAIGRVLGQVIPAQPAEIEVRGRRPADVSADAMGRFVCDEVPPGPFSLRCRFPAAVVTTEWIVI
ncbi:hypothetical protein [Sphaerisporangium corydalis]|uniref:Carboxypeptidase regulatory-like domain-containing protein n=1 Tax=Sphaerisporangium corydalis TaxID=1441875 RepID=A0ABV9E9Q9_9ACTN|nr:hypothetical protein [Sphaerisporangium corydalis]